MRSHGQGLTDLALTNCPTYVLDLGDICSFCSCPVIYDRLVLPISLFTAMGIELTLEIFIK